MSNIPELRFKEFSGEWEEKKLGDIAIFFNSKRVPLTDRDRVKGIYPYYGASGIIDYVNNYIFDGEYILLGEDGANILMRNSRLVFLANGKFWVNNHAHVFQALESNYFLCEALERIRYDRYNTGTAQPKLNSEVVKKIQLFLPQKQEQQKIASFLTTIDTKIEQLSKKVELQEQYKKGVMQKIFNQEIRFKNDDGSEFDEWEEKKLKDVLFEHKTRNSDNNIKEVFSVAKTKGIINQIEHLGRSYASKDLRNYKIVFPNDIVYTKSPTSDFPYGIIKKNKLNRIGVVSTLYAVFKPINSYISSYLDYYFDSWINTYNYLHPLVQKGAKNTMNINNNDFLNGKNIFMPISENEQKKIYDFLSTLDKQIDSTKKQLAKTKEFKKGLLQRMFV